MDEELKESGYNMEEEKFNYFCFCDNYFFGTWVLLPCVLIILGCILKLRKTVIILTSRSSTGMCTDLTFISLCLVHNSHTLLHKQLLYSYSCLILCLVSSVIFIIIFIYFKNMSSFVYFKNWYEPEPTLNEPFGTEPAELVINVEPDEPEPG